jgi:hypothetical protein
MMMWSSPTRARTKPKDRNNSRSLPPAWAMKSPPAIAAASPPLACLHPDRVAASVPCSFTVGSVPQRPAVSGAGGAAGHERQRTCLSRGTTRARDAKPISSTEPRPFGWSCCQVDQAGRGFALRCDGARAGLSHALPRHRPVGIALPLSRHTARTAALPDGRSAAICGMSARQVIRSLRCSAPVQQGPQW